jgi:hypothetical protein
VGEPNGRSNGNGKRTIVWGAVAVVVSVAIFVMGGFVSGLRTFQGHDNAIAGLKEAQRKTEERLDKHAEAIGALRYEVVQRNERMDNIVHLMNEVKSLVERDQVKQIQTREDMRDRLIRLEEIVKSTLEMIKRR